MIQCALVVVDCEQTAVHVIGADSDETDEMRMEAIIDYDEILEIGDITREFCVFVDVLDMMDQLDFDDEVDDEVD